MAKYTFLYRVANSEDRDACAYIETRNGARRFDCGHYFGGINLQGACYCGGTPEPFENIETILTAEEYAELWQIDNELHTLGYGITEGDERYNKGLEICARLQPIIDKLQSDEAQQFFARIIEEEKNYCAEHYSLDPEDVDAIFEEYGEDYQDRSIISTVWEDVEEMAEAYAEDCLDIPDNMKRYFDYSALGEDMMEDGKYYELSSGRIVEFA